MLDDFSCFPMKSDSQAVERPNQLGDMMKLRLDDPVPIAGGPSSKYRSSSVAAQSVSPNRGPTPDSKK